MRKGSIYPHDRLRYLAGSETILEAPPVLPVSHMSTVVDSHIQRIVATKELR